MATVQNLTVTPTEIACEDQIDIEVDVTFSTERGGVVRVEVLKDDCWFLTHDGEEVRTLQQRVEQADATVNFSTLLTCSRTAATRIRAEAIENDSMEEVVRVDC